jgi:hypothetical protein
MRRLRRVTSPYVVAPEFVYFNREASCGQNKDQYRTSLQSIHWKKYNPKEQLHVNEIVHEYF